jgi:K+-sensing histidine kinase KdpD
MPVVVAVVARAPGGVGNRPSARTDYWSVLHHQKAWLDEFVVVVVVVVAIVVAVAAGVDVADVGALFLVGVVECAILESVQRDHEHEQSWK